MTELLTIRETAAVLGCRRADVFGLLYARTLRATQLEPDGALLIEASAIAAMRARAWAWARAWGEGHPGEERVDRLVDWAE